MQGDRLDVAIRDLASGSDYAVRGTMVYQEDGVGAFLSEPLDTSSLLPWQRLQVEVSGEFAGTQVEQTFELTREDLPEAGPVALLSAMKLLDQGTDGERDDYVLYAAAGGPRLRHVRRGTGRPGLPLHGRRDRGAGGVGP